MEVDCLMLADGAQAVGGKVYVLGGGWNTIWARTFPADQRISVVIGLRVGWNETNERHALELKTLTEDGNPFQEIGKVEFEAGRPPGLKAGSEQVVMVAIGCAIKLDEPRELQMALSVGGVSKSIPFRIVAASGGAPPPPSV